MTPLVGAKLNGQIFCNPCISWKSNNFVCRLSMSWLYVSTGIMISVNSVLEIDRAIAIISPFHRIQFQDQFLTEIYFLFFFVSISNLYWTRSKHCMSFYIPGLLVILHLIYCAPVFFSYEIVCDHCMQGIVSCFFNIFSRLLVSIRK